MANIQQSVNQLLYSANIAAGFAANTPAAKEMKELGNIKRQQKLKSKQAQEVSKAKSQALEEAGVPDPVKNPDFEDLSADIMDMLDAEDINIDKMVSPKIPRDPLEKRRRELDLNYAREQMNKDIQKGKQEAIKVVKKLLQEKQDRQGFKDLVFSEEQAGGMAEDVLAAIGPKGVGSYNLELIRKGGSK